jgi:hypothetical protein
MQLSVVLKRGFRGDDAEVWIDGERVYQRQGLTTLTTIDRADSFDRVIPGEVAVVEVTLPTRGLCAKTTVHGSGRVSLAASVQGEKLVLQHQAGAIGDA